MGPEYGKIAIGVSAATGVVLVSFLLLKKFGFQDKSNVRASKVRTTAQEDKLLPTEETGDQLANARLDLSEQSNVRDKSEQQGFIDKGLEEEKNNLGLEEEKNNLSFAGENQQSFILINDDDVPENNAGKKSDRSSDESSYDVIENDRLNDHVDDEEVAVHDEDVAMHEEDVVADAEDVAPAESAKADPDIKTAEDVNMSSMVFVEESPCVGQDKSGSSLFVSAGEFENTDSSTFETLENQSAPSLIPIKETVETAADVTGANKTEDVSENNSSYLQETIEHVGDEAIPLIDALVSQDLEAIEKVSNTLTKDEGTKIQDEELRTSDEHEGSIEDPQTVSITSSEESAQRTQDVLLSCQNSPGSVTHEDISYLVDLLSKNSTPLQSTVLDCLTRVTAFTQNINVLRECGCPKILVQQVKDLVSRTDIDEKQLISVCNVLTNLSLDPKIKQELGDLLPELTHVVQSQGVSETLLLSAFRTLVNLSSESDLHHLYSDLIGTLYSLLCNASQPARLLSVKVLVNLSLSGDLVDKMLTAKAPESLTALLDNPSYDLILRCVTLLSNLYSVMSTTNLNPESLASSPDTVQSILTDETNKSALRAKALQLTRHDDEDLRYEASKLHNFLS